METQTRKFQLPIPKSSWSSRGRFLFEPGVFLNAAVEAWGLLATSLTLLELLAVDLVTRAAFGELVLAGGEVIFTGLGNLTLTDALGDFPFCSALGDFPLCSFLDGDETFATFGEISFVGLGGGTFVAFGDPLIVGFGDAGFDGFDVSFASFVGTLGCFGDVTFVGSGDASLTGFGGITFTGFDTASFGFLGDVTFVGLAEVTLVDAKDLADLLVAERARFVLFTGDGLALFLVDFVCGTESFLLGLTLAF